MKAKIRLSDLLIDGTKLNNEEYSTFNNFSIFYYPQIGKFQVKEPKI